MSKEYDALMEHHPIYGKMLGRWRFLMNSFMGGEKYKKNGYLTRYAYESEIDYEERLRQTPLDNQCRSIINVYNAFLFREPCEREFGSIETDPSLEPFLKDADLDGRSLNSFMKEASTYSSIFGHCWIVLAKPNSNARTRAEELEQEIRPYVNMITPLNVLNWEWSRSASGYYYLSYLKYIEDSEYENFTTIKEWTEDEIKTHIIDEEGKEVRETMVEPNQLARIPAIPVYSQRSPYRGIGISDIEDIADHQRKIFNELSEVEQAIRINGHPSLVKTAEVEASAGAGAIIQMPENMDPGLKPYMLAVATDTSSIYESIQQSVDAIDRMANTGAVRAKSTRTMSGVAMEVEFSMLNSRLSEKADNLELAEEHLWRIWAQYQGKSWDGEINYPDSFAIHDTDRDFVNLEVAKKTITDPRVARVIDERILELLDEDYEEILGDDDEMEHPVTTTADRSSHIQEMIMQGYTDEQILALHGEITQDDINQAKQQLLDTGSES